jgi:hypothetical protein
MRLITIWDKKKKKKNNGIFPRNELHENIALDFLKHKGKTSFITSNISSLLKKYT